MEGGREEGERTKRIKERDRENRHPWSKDGRPAEKERGGRERDTKNSEEDWTDSDDLSEKRKRGGEGLEMVVGVGGGGELIRSVFVLTLVSIM